MMLRSKSGWLVLNYVGRGVAVIGRLGLLHGVLALISMGSIAFGQDTSSRVAPPIDEKQLPREMHSQMEILPSIRVGQKEGDVFGNDHRVLQSAVDYMAGLGGGTVYVGPGEYLMRDSLHLRSKVAIVGTEDATVLKKAPSVTSPLVLDGDFGEQQVTVQDAQGFDVGCGVAIWDDRAGGFHTTVARITGRKGNTFSIDKPLMADCMVSQNAKASTVFPVISGYDAEGVLIQGLTINGSKDCNDYLNGCRGAGIFLYRSHGTTIERCVARGYHGDGIGFQQSNDVNVLDCISEENTHLGLHPGSGSQRPSVLRCKARSNGEDGLFLCWRVRHGQFRENLFENNGRFGISIGHKDTDNLLASNHIQANGEDGIHFRNESYGMAAHRNRLVDNVIENNGTKGPAAGIRVRGETEGLVFDGNIIRDTRVGEQRTQSVGIRIDDSAGEIEIRENKIEAATLVEDRRRQKKD